MKLKSQLAGHLPLQGETERGLKIGLLQIMPLVAKPSLPAEDRLVCR